MSDHAAGPPSPRLSGAVIRKPVTSSGPPVRVGDRRDTEAMRIPHLTRLSGGSPTAMEIIVPLDALLEVHVLLCAMALAPVELPVPAQGCSPGRVELEGGTHLQPEGTLPGCKRVPKSESTKPRDPSRVLP